MRENRRIVFIVYDGFELIDMTGPCSVFSTANDHSERPGYELVVASPEGGQIAGATGLQVTTVGLSRIRWRATDTVLVTGAQQKPLQVAMRDEPLLRQLRLASDRVERYGSVCSGAFVLAAAGLLDGKRCTTHWAAHDRLGRHYPKARVEDDALFCTEGSLWTSAGASAGIDMALAMLEQDAGTQMMGLVAKWLVVYARRPGNQSQFSAVLHAQTAEQSEFAPVADWMIERLDRPIRVQDMANQVAMTERTFYRRFTQSLGITPAKYLEALRLERARSLLEVGTAVKVVASRVGFQSDAAFRTAFKARYGTTPSLHAQMFQADGQSGDKRLSV